MVKKKIGGISKKEAFFYLIYFVLLLFECWPGLFLGNRATPFVFGLPFFLFYQYIFVFVTVAFFIVQYVLDNKDGELDFQVDPDHDYLKDAAELVKKGEL